MTTAAPIVIVDDRSSEAELTARFLEICGVHAPTVNLDSGGALLAHLQRVLDGEAPSPRLVLLDARMPGMDGFQALLAVTKLFAPDAPPRIVMLSNTCLQEQRARARQLGVEDYVQKPRNLAEFRALVAALGLTEAQRVVG